MEALESRRDGLSRFEPRVVFRPEAVGRFSLRKGRGTLPPGYYCFRSSGVLPVNIYKLQTVEDDTTAGLTRSKPIGGSTHYDGLPDRL